MPANRLFAIVPEAESRRGERRVNQTAHYLSPRPPAQRLRLYASDRRKHGHFRPDWSRIQKGSGKFRLPSSLPDKKQARHAVPTEKTWIIIAAQAAGRDIGEHQCTGADTENHATLTIKPGHELSGLIGVRAFRRAEANGDRGDRPVVPHKELPAIEPGALPRIAW